MNTETVLNHLLSYPEKKRRGPGKNLSRISGTGSDLQLSVGIPFESVCGSYSTATCKEKKLGQLSKMFSFYGV